MRMPEPCACVRGAGRVRPRLAGRRARASLVPVHAAETRSRPQRRVHAVPRPRRRWPQRNLGRHAPKNG